VVEARDRDLLAETLTWLSEHPHSTVKEAAKGAGVSESDMRDFLERRHDVFKVRTGEEAKAVDRHPSARVWEVREGALTDSAHLGAPAVSGVGVSEGALVRPPVGSAPATSAPTPAAPGCAADSGAPGAGRPVTDPRRSGGRQQ